MKTTLIIILLTFTTFVFGQTGILSKYQTADSLFQADNSLDAYNIFKEIEAKCDKKDTLYSYILWYYIGATCELEQQKRMNEQFESSLIYGIEALSLIEKGKKYFDEEFAARKYWMYKNIIVSYFGLGKLDKAKQYQDKLYKAYKDKALPDGIDKYYNFEFFKWEGKNIWAYEYYPEIGDQEAQGSFSKIEYYVYSTNSDGSDKEELYRLCVLKFHKLNNSVSFDYVLTKRLITAKDEVNGSLYAYTYKSPIDYVKLRKDIVEVLKGNYQPDTKSVIIKK